MYTGSYQSYYSLFIWMIAREFLASTTEEVRLKLKYTQDDTIPSSWKLRRFLIALGAGEYHDRGVWTLYFQIRIDRSGFILRQPRSYHIQRDSDLIIFT